MSNTKLIPINHFRAFVAEGELFLTASSVEGVQRLSTLFPNAKWPQDEDGCSYCDTGIKVQDKDIRFDDDGYDEASRKRERARVACVASECAAEIAGGGAAEIAGGGAAEIAGGGDGEDPIGASRFLLPMDRIALDRDILSHLILNAIGRMQKDERGHAIKTGEARDGHLDVRIVIEGKQYPVSTDFKTMIGKAWDKAVRTGVKSWITDRMEMVGEALRDAVAKALDKPVEEYENYEGESWDTTD